MNKDNTYDSDELDEDVVPKKNDTTQTPQTTENMNLSDLPDLSKLNLNALMESFKSRNPKDLKKMISKMGITDAQISQMQKSYQQGGLPTTITETDPRKRIVEKLKQKRMMRQNKSIKHQYLQDLQEKTQTQTQTQTQSNQEPAPLEEIEIETISTETISTETISTETISTEAISPEALLKKNAQNRAKKLRKKQNKINKNNSENS